MQSHWQISVIPKEWILQKVITTSIPWSKAIKIPLIFRKILFVWITPLSLGEKKLFKFYFSRKKVYVIPSGNLITFYTALLTFWNSEISLVLVFQLEMLSITFMTLLEEHSIRLLYSVLLDLIIWNAYFISNTNFLATFLMSKGLQIFFLFSNGIPLFLIYRTLE